MVKNNLNALFLVGDGFEDIECIMTLDILTRGGVKCSIINVNDEVTTTSASKVTIVTETLTANVDSIYDIVIVPGGKSANIVAKSPAATNLIKKHNELGKWTAAICAGPIALSRAGIIDEITISCYPSESITSSIKNAKITKDHLAINEQKKIITAKGPASATVFGLAILELLTSKDVAHEVGRSMLFGVGKIDLDNFIE
ncbi:hypothetical protein ASO20_00525 [Mycoplasma sp. (ex Biomphalaria glabrata)]|uniref:DJ-1/PfpI family protein n=1 Tax=Mycoplasma sp. (ex Biomphalaria glabrata) TaxID=1749074 RepID=UPI00073ACFD0|nr:DJ-1/PfpI family protein [Mycoplasma sp. (ex Biomphalaria glabrata)]ALV23161.1 hypothetical protein ASO20_00525 [Mycoplasma sp. (ex Biomphalaria glabrata)]